MRFHEIGCFLIGVLAILPVSSGCGSVVVVPGEQGATGVGGGSGSSSGSSGSSTSTASGGAATWSRVLPGANGNDLPTGLAVTPTGDVVISGWFEDTLDAGGAPLVSSGVLDTFLVVLDAAGDQRWSRRLGFGEDQIGGPVAVDAAGDIVITAAFKGSIDFGGCPLDAPTADQITAVAKLDPSGKCLWSKSFDGIISAAGVAVDAQGDILVAGRDANVLVKLDAAGTELWRRSLPGLPGLRVNLPSLGVDAQGRSVLVVSDETTYLPSVLAFDATGTQLWTRPLPPQSTEGCVSPGMLAWLPALAVAPSGTIALTGPEDCAVDFGDGLLPAGQPSVALLDGDGNFLVSRSFAGNTASWQRIGFDPSGTLFLWDEGSSARRLLATLGPSLEVIDQRSFASDDLCPPLLAPDPLGGVVIAGCVSSSTDLGDGVLTTPGVFVARLAP
jgi:hypothetical protein